MTTTITEFPLPPGGMIRERFGVECSIRHFDTPVVVEGPAAG